MPKKKQNLFLIIRKKIEDNANNKVKKTTGQDLFDWLLLALWSVGGILISISPKYFPVEPKDAINGLLLWFTAFVILRYTKETYFLKKLAQKQNITSIRPYLRLQWQTSDNLVLVNEGRGVAVALKPRYEADGLITELVNITAMADAPNSFTTNFIPQGFSVPNPENNNYQIKIRYQDIESRRYIAVFRSSSSNNDKFTIIRQKEG